MARFLITNSISLLKKAEKINENSGLKKAGTFRGKNFQGIVYDKRVKKTNNFEEINNNEVIAVTGTLIYNGKINVNAILKDEDRIDMENKNDWIGHYAVIHMHGDNIKIFTDRIGSYEVYYLNYRDDIFISNSLYLTGSIIESGSISNIGLLEKIAFVQNITNSTVIDKVDRLGVNESISIDGSNFNIKKENNVKYVRKGPRMSSSTEISEELRNTARQIVDNERKVGLHFTGGLDSRTLLASFMSVDSSPLLLYGVGDSQITNTKNEDFQVFDLVSKQFNLNSHIMDWRYDYTTQNVEVLSEYVKRYGFKCQYYGCNRSALREYEGRINPYPDIMVLGLGKVLTNHKPWEIYKENEEYALRNIVKDLLSIPKASITNYDHFEEKMVGRIKNIANIEQEQINGSSIVRLQTILGNKAPSFHINTINEFAPCICPFATHNMTSLFLNTTHSQRGGNKLQVKIISDLQKSLLNINIYSGMKSASIENGIVKKESGNYDSMSYLSKAFSRSKKVVKDMFPKEAKSLIKRSLGLNTHDEVAKRKYIKTLESANYPKTMDLGLLSPRSANRAFIYTFSVHHALGEDL